MQRFDRQRTEDGENPSAHWGKDRVEADSEDPDDEDNVPIPDVGSIPATGKIRVSSIRDWSEDEDDDCRVYDPLPVAYSYPMSPNSADSDEVIEVAPLAVGPKGPVRKRSAAASADVGPSGTSGPAQKRARVKTIVKRRDRPVSKG